MRFNLNDAIEKIKKDSQIKTLFVNVDRQEDYVALINALKAYKSIKVSSYINNDTDALKIVEIEQELSALKEITVVLGLMSYYAFRNGDPKIKEQVKHYVLNTDKKIFICYGLSTVLSEITDIRIKDSIVLVGNGGDGIVPSITLSKNKDNRTHQSFSSFYADLERSGRHVGTVNTSLDKQAFSKKWKVDDEPTGYKKIRELGIFSSIHASLGDTKQWDWLTKQNKKSLSREEIELKICNWNSLQENEKWQCFLSARNLSACYLGHVAGKSENLIDFVLNIYNGLSDDFDVSDKRFSEYYGSRKKLVMGIKDAGCLDAFCNLSKARGANRIYYLTDLTLQEKEQIIESIVEYRPNCDELLKATQAVYPFLYDYLSDYDFGELLLDGYFNQSGYKYYKLLNNASDEFLALVKKNGVKREYGRLDSVESVIKGLDLSNAGKYWVDALGIEFVSFIKARAAFYGLTVIITPATTGLPSTTEQNKKFLNQLGFNKDDGSLDDLKHARAKNVKYENVKNAIYLVRELEIIDEFIETLSGVIKNGTARIVVASDHGASRLALVHRGEAIENSGKAVDIRFAESGSVDVSKYAQVTSPQNGYHCIANYDFMKGGRTTGVETHGGATLEEVVVPIIELALDKGIKFTYRIVNTILKLKNKVLDKLKMVLSSHANDVYVKLKGNVIKPSKLVSNELEFELGLDKPDEYEVAVFVDKSKIGTSKIKVVSDLAEEIDMF